MQPKTKSMRAIEARYNQPIESLLSRWYVQDRETQEAIAHRLEVHTSTVCKWLERFRVVDSKAVCLQ